MCKSWKCSKKLIIESDGLSQCNKIVDSSGSCAEKKDESNFSKNSIVMNAKSIWGAIVGKLRQLNMMALYVSCGEIRDVSLNENELTVLVKEDYLYNILSKDENYKKLLEVLKMIDNSLVLCFVRPGVKDNRSLFNFNKLKDLFGEDLEFE